MTWFHGSVTCDLDIGAVLLPASESGNLIANPRMNVDLVEEHDDGVSRHDLDVVWLSTDKDDAQDWGAKPLLKCTGEDIRRMQQERGKPVALIVYTVEPVGPVFRRLTPHSEQEYGCTRAVIVGRETVEVYDWREFEYEKNPDGTWTDVYSGDTFTSEQLEEAT